MSLLAVDCDSGVVFGTFSARRQGHRIQLPPNRVVCCLTFQTSEGSTCSPIGMNSPRRATMNLFAKPRLGIVK